MPELLIAGGTEFLDVFAYRICSFIHLFILIVRQTGISSGFAGQ
jgi:hypothetical protein